jgi:hypothetical protein
MRSPSNTTTSLASPADDLGESADGRRGPPAGVVEIVLNGSGRPARSGRHRDVRIAHIGWPVLAEGGLIEADFRKRDKEKSAHAGV